jgi:hypothetical protein
MRLNRDKALNTSNKKRESDYLLKQSVFILSSFFISLIIFAPILLSYIRYLYRLLKNTNPALGWAEAILSDSIRIASGIFPIGDPNTTAVGQLYGLAFPFLNAAFIKLLPWAGWTLLLNIISVCIGVLVSSYFSIRWALNKKFSPQRRVITALTMGSVFSGLSLIALNIPNTDLLFEGRADHFSWIVTILGVYFSLSRIENRNSRIVSILLISFGFQSKYTVVPLIIALVIAVALVMRSKPNNRKLFGSYMIALGATNLILLLVLEILSGGWYLRVTLFLPLQHSRITPFSIAIRELGVLIAILFALFALFFYSSVSFEQKKFEQKNYDSNRVFLIFLGLSFFLLIPFMILSRIKQGGADNQYIGAIWVVIFFVSVLVPKTAEFSVEKVFSLCLVSAITVTFLPLTLNGSSSVGLRNEFRIMANMPSSISEMPNFDSQNSKTEKSLVEYSPYAATRNFFQSHQNPLLVNIVDQFAAGYKPVWLLDKMANENFLVMQNLDVGADYYASAYGLQDFGMLAAINEFGVTSKNPVKMISCTRSLYLDILKLIRVSKSGFLCANSESQYRNGLVNLSLEGFGAQSPHWTRLDGFHGGNAKFNSDSGLLLALVPDEEFVPGKTEYVDKINDYLMSSGPLCQIGKVNEISINRALRYIDMLSQQNGKSCRLNLDDNHDVYVGFSELGTVQFRSEKG